MDQLEKEEREGQPIDKEPENDKKDWSFIQSFKGCLSMQRKEFTVNIFWVK